MRIAVIGAGAIGGLVAGYLKQKGEDVFLVGHADSVAAIKKNGLRISGIRGGLKVNIEAYEKLNETPDLAILCVKTQDIEGIIKDNQQYLKESCILTTQNGVQADNLLSEYIPKENIISSIVMFGSTYLKPAEIVHNFEGAWIIGRIFGPHHALVEKIKDTLNKIFPVVISEDVQGMKYLKIFVNANNCIAAILGKSMQEAFSNPEISRISIAIWKEGMNLVKKSGINLTSLPDFPLERLNKLLSLPEEEAAKIFSGIMINLSKEPLYGSILQSIKRNRPSEIDYINGEFLRLAKENNQAAPLNEKLVALVHQAEKTKNFLTPEELISEVKTW